MDLDEDEFEMPSSPLFGAMNTAKKRHEDHLVNHTGTDKRPVKKRKTLDKKAQNKDAKFKQENGSCDFFLWEQHYAYFITGVGINMLIEAAGGGSNFMFGMAGFMRDIKAVVMNTFTICIIILSVLAFHFT